MNKASLEIRINSIQDAKSVVYNMEKINRTRETLGLESIEFIVANEVKAEVAGIIHGVFKCKTFTSYTRTRGESGTENVLFQLPHFPEQRSILVVNKENGSTKPVTIAKRRGRPPRRKEVNVPNNGPAIGLLPTVHKS